jgi:methylmalonyl-CoA mutase
LPRNSSPYKPKNKLRFITATSLFDGHDASINIMRRIHAGDWLPRSFTWATTARCRKSSTRRLQEDVQGICDYVLPGRSRRVFQIHDGFAESQVAVSEIKVFGGGGGVIVPSEIKELHEYGVTRIYAPEDGVQMGLQGMINDLVQQCGFRCRRWSKRRSSQRTSIEPRLQAGDQAQAGARYYLA